MKKGEKKRSPGLILLQRRTIAKYYLQGRNVIDIAALVKLSRKTVYEEIENLKLQWVTAADIDFAEAQGAALSKIDQMEQEAVNEYIKSKKRKTIRTRKKEPHMVPTGRTVINEEGDPEDEIEIQMRLVEETMRTEQGTGDVRWHDQILKCIDMRLKILGLYKQKIGGSEDGSIRPEIANETTKSKVSLLLAVIEEWGGINGNNQ